MLKRVAICLLCLMITFLATFSFIVGVVLVPTIYSYADSVTDGWTQVTTNEQLVDAFRDYCKSRDLTIEGSAADVVTSFTTQTFNNICRGIGIDVTALQAHLKYASDSNGGIKWLFDSTGITAYNAIFAQFLQDNELSVGDTISQEDPKTMYSGKIVTDNDNYYALVYYMDGTSGYWGNISKEGSIYKYSGDDIASLVGSYDIGNKNQSPLYTNITQLSFNLNVSNSPLILNARAGTESAYSYSSGYFVMNSDSYNTSPILSQIVNGGYFSSETNPPTQTRVYSGGTAIIYNVNNNSYHLGTVQYDDSGRKRVTPIKNLTFREQPTNANVFIYSPTINNNIYEGDTIINPDGTPNTPQPSGGTPPNWDIGGGDGSATDGNGNTWNIKFPDFELPDLNIDWQIHGLGDKFPFSIPFDLVSLVTVLNAEPEAPRFEGTVNFGFTTWDYDINLDQFDSVASACRIAELLLLVFGLILITRSIIKG